MFGLNMGRKLQPADGPKHPCLQLGSPQYAQEAEDLVNFKVILRSLFAGSDGGEGDAALFLTFWMVSAKCASMIGFDVSQFCDVNGYADLSQGLAFAQA